MQRYTGSVIRKFDSNNTGNIAANVLVTVRDSTGALADLYSQDSTLSPLLPNPLSTDVNGQYTFFAVDGKYNITFNNGAPTLLDVQIKDILTGGEAPITLEQFNTLAGTGGNDTAAWELAVAESFATGRPIQLLGKTYLISPNIGGTSVYTIKGGLRGYGDASVIKCFSQAQSAETAFLLDIVLAGGGFIENFRIDGNLTSDPATWTNANINTFSGSRGLRLLNSTGVIIQNVSTVNTFGAGIYPLLCNNVEINNCRTYRTRGAFGDGFTVAESKQVTYNNCYAYDFTRIGFVADKTSGDACEHITYNNCIAKYGHDSSILYGGGEYNSGYWHEFAVNVTYNNCGAEEAGVVFGRGFTCAMAYDTDTTEALPEIYGTTYNDCWVKGTGADLQAFGFSIGSLGNTRGVITLNNCHVEGTQLPYNLSSDRNLIRLVNCTASNDGLLETTGPVRQSVLCVGGDIEIVGFREYINLPSGNWDALNDNVGQCSIGSFGEARPVKLVIKNLKSFQYDTKVQIPSRVQQGFSVERADILIEDAWLDQNLVIANTIDYNKVKFKTVGANNAPEYLKFTTCQFNLDDTPTGGGQLPTNILDTGTISIVDSYVTISGTDYLYFNNSATNNLGRIKIDNCVFSKNVSANGYMIRLNEEQAGFNTSDLQWLDISNCRFINTGSTTSNPIVFSDQRNFVGNNAVVRVFGAGNFKSSTITNNATAGVTTSQWTVTALS